jgi:hypothetical protein
MNQLFTAPTDLAPATLAKSADINAITAAVGTAFNKLPTELELKTGTINYAVDTGTANAYLVALPYAPASYTDGLSVVFKALNTNTGASTINVNGLGAKTIRLSDDHVVYAGDITAGSSVTLRYSSTTGYFHVAANSVVSANRSEQAAVDAEAAWASFDDRYLGAKAAQPSVDNDGAALLVGAMYWNNSSDTMWAYTGSAWSALSPTDAEMALITIVGGELTVTEDLGSITAAITTGTGNNISIVGDAIANVNTVAVSVADVNTVATNIASVNTTANATNLAAILDAPTQAGIATTKASAASASAAAALVSENAAAADLVLTNADVVLAEADKVQTGLDKIATNADVVLTHADVVLAEADKVQTGLDSIATAADAATSATQAGIATTKAGEASSSASSAATAQAAAEAARDSALASFDSFDDRYLGQKASNPTTDNDGNALVGGTLYFNSTSEAMMVYEGSAWVAAYASLAGALLTTNNLSDLNNAGTARTNLGVDAAGTVNYTHPANHAISVITGLQAALDGIDTDLVNDTTPQLGGALDGQNNNMTNIGTVSGSNLQLDFGGL